MAVKHKAAQWFTIDPNGLRQLLARRGYGFIVHELVQNAWDAPGVKHVSITIVDDKGMLELTVTDNAFAGVKELSDLYTLFAPSEKKSDVTKRGRFNLGEKLAISCANSARVTTVAGTIYFRPNGTREYNGNRRTTLGTEVNLRLMATKAVTTQLVEAARHLIPPPAIPTTLTIQGAEEPINRPRLIGGADSVSLPTEVDKGDGLLHATVRKASVLCYEQLTGAWLYEMGIPVCATSFPWHVDVAQKVPLTLDRENVTPSFLRKLGVVLLNHLYEQLTTVEQATEPWVRQAAADPECHEYATKHLAKLRFGERSVAYDPSDPEASMRAMAEGYTVVHGGSMSKGEWENVRKTTVLLPAGKVTGTPTAISTIPGEGKQLNELTQDQLSPEEQVLIEYATWLANELVDRHVTVKCFRDRAWTVIAACGEDAVLVLNLGRLQWHHQDELHRVLIHELAHITETNHLDDRYHQELSRLGARFGRVACGNHQRVVQWTWPLKAAALREEETDA